MSVGVNPTVANAIMVTVTAVWALSLVLSVVSLLVPAIPDYKPEPYIHGAFLAIVGTAFASKRGSSGDS